MNQIIDVKSPIKNAMEHCKYSLVYISKLKFAIELPIRSWYAIKQINLPLSLFSPSFPFSFSLLFPSLGLMIA